ncbi:hypothetical protein BASA81_003933 [Batrachochytrium salamandrivorans]|nr:hypothetical protein BASA81_003933 [Batrachochytrium salamandrivorans]
MQTQLEWDGIVVPVQQPLTWAAVVEASKALNMSFSTSGLEVFYEDDEQDRIKIANEMGMEAAVSWAKAQGLDRLRLFVDAPFEDDASWDKLEVPSSPTTTVASVPQPPPLSVGPSMEEPAVAVPAVANWESASESEEEEDEQPMAEEETSVVEEASVPEEEEVSVPEEEEASVPEEEEDAASQLSAEEDGEDSVEDAMNLYVEEEDVPASQSGSWGSSAAGWGRTIAHYSSSPWQEDEASESELNEHVEQLVSKIISNHHDDDSASSPDLTALMMQMCGNRQVVDLLANAVQDVRLRQAISGAANAELETAGAGAKIAKLQVVAHFSSLCAQLVQLVPEFESALLRFLSPSASKPAAAPKRLEHSKVFCDGCQEDSDAAKRAVAEGFRSATTHYICGIRYKSGSKVDFDLCELCEASDKYQASHGPFLKLRTITECPEIILCVPKAAEGLSLASHLDLNDQQPVLAQEMAEFLDFRKQQECVASSARRHPPSLATAPASLSKKSCKHALRTFETQHAGFHCDGCGRKANTKTMLHGCRLCNFDLCSECMSATNNAPVVSPPTVVVAAVTTAVATPSPMVVVRPPPALAVAVAMPQAKFVCDVTLADGSIVRPGEHLQKTWRIRNVGDELWPAGTKLMHVGGDAMGGPRLGQDLPAQVKPGDCVNVTVDLVMPNLPGRYTSYWRLMTPTPTSAKFGHRFWVTVNVVPAPPPPPASSFPSSFLPPPPPPVVEQWFSHEPFEVAAPPSPPRPFAAPLPSTLYNDMAEDEFSMSVARIVDLGFTDMDRIVRVLREENGHTGRAIDRLLEDRQ